MSSRRKVMTKKYHQDKTYHTYPGLNFCMHADAAWGGYICTMLDRKKESTGGSIMRRGSHYRKVTDKEYVFTSPLNDHSKVCVISVLVTLSTILSHHR
jgi:hypothetical protein